MKGTLLKAWGYQGDAMSLPVADTTTAAQFYEKVLGFRIEARGHDPCESVTLQRDKVRMRLAENGGDPSQDGIAFQVDDIETLFQEFSARGWEPPAGKEDPFDVEDHDDGKWRVFFVVAPDGLCFWFGEKLEETGDHPVDE